MPYCVFLLFVLSAATDATKVDAIILHISDRTGLDLRSQKLEKQHAAVLQLVLQVGFMCRRVLIDFISVFK